jgi:MFS family permease
MVERSHPEEPRVVAEQPVSLWRNRDYMAWWTGNGMSTLGTAVSTIAFPLLVLHTTGSLAQAGSITAAQMIGTLVTLAVGGALADRVSRRLVMIVAPLVQGAALGLVALLVYRGAPSILALDALALISGFAAGLRTSVSMPALRRIVPKEQVSTATAQGMGRDMIAHLVGAPLGGLLFSLARWAPFLFDALSFLFVTAGALLIRRPLGPDRDTDAGRPPGMLADITDGLRMIRRSDYLMFTIVWGALLNVVTEGFTLLFIALVHHRGGGPAAVGTATSLALVGGVIGAVAGPWMIRRLGARRVLTLSAWVVTATFAITVWTPQPWQIGVVTMIGMISMVPLNVVTESYQVRLVPDAYLGRVAATNRFCVQAVQWSGPLGAGFAADAIGVPGAVLVLTAVMAVLALALWVYRRRLDILDVPLSEVRELEPPAPGPREIAESTAGATSAESPTSTAGATSAESTTGAAGTESSPEHHDDREPSGRL